MKRHDFAYEALAGEQYEALRPDLVKVQESIGNTAFAAEVKQSASRDAFFKAGLHHPHQPPVNIYTAPLTLHLYFTFNIHRGNVLSVLAHATCCAVTGHEGPESASQ